MLLLEEWREKDVGKINKRMYKIKLYFKTNKYYLYYLYVIILAKEII